MKSTQVDPNQILGHQNICLSIMIIINGLPSCLIFYFVGHQLDNVESYSFKAPIPKLA